jgi:hypothetical protein
MIMQQDNLIEFKPFRGLTWEDFLSWLAQSNSECHGYIRSTLNAFKSLMRGSLPEAYIDGKVLVMIWNEGAFIFEIKMKNSHVHKNHVHIEWCIYDVNHKPIVFDSHKEMGWLPPKMINAFQTYWNEIHSNFHLYFLMIISLIIALMTLIISF